MDQPPPLVLRGARSDLACADPPCTYLEPKSEHEEMVRTPNGDELTLKVIEVSPSVPS